MLNRYLELKTQIDSLMFPGMVASGMDVMSKHYEFIEGFYLNVLNVVNNTKVIIL